MFELAHLAIGIVALTVALLAALQDVRERLIANRLVALLLVLGPLHHVVSSPSAAQALAATGGALGLAAAVFVIGFGVWRLGVLGGGDVKLLVAATLFVGLDGGLVLLASTALAGGVLALLYLLAPCVQSISSLRVAGAVALGTNDRPRSLPYGVAIAAGFSCALVPSLPLLIG